MGEWRDVTLRERLYIHIYAKLNVSRLLSSATLYNIFLARKLAHTYNNMYTGL